MKNNFYFNEPLANLYLKPSINSEVTSQILYGQKFKILKKFKNWVKIKLSYDNYTGYIKNSNFYSKFNQQYKISKLKADVYSIRKNKFIKIKKNIYFGSTLSIISKSNKFYQFEKNKWIRKKDIVHINYKEKNIRKILELFLNTKYIWGGRSSEGIDCSGLVQIYFYYNKIFCPRDTIDQIPFFQRNKKKFQKICKNLIFWKGHVAICINKKNLIHAYGPKKKVIKMSIIKTIKKINYDTGLNPIYIN